MSTWTKYVFTIRVCRSKQQLILSVATVLVTSLPPAPSCSQHSGISPHIQFSVPVLLCFVQNLIFDYLTLYFDRKKLDELDNIQRYFSRKLSTPTFPSISEQDCQSKQEEQSDKDSSQLLLKSNQLVGEVNNIISGELFVMLKTLMGPQLKARQIQHFSINRP